MKTIEEKAKAYDEVLEKAKEIVNDQNASSVWKEWLCNCFPELKESEDEKIRKAIVNAIHNYAYRLEEKIPTEWLVWLEKQGEQKPLRMVSAKAKEAMYDKPAWSEEDENILGDIIEDVMTLHSGKTLGVIRNKINWLKSLQGRVQPKQEWNEEDEPQKELAESYLAKFDEKFPILPTLKGKQLADYKNFLNKCQQIFRLKYWGIRPIQAKLFEKLSLLWAAWGAEHLQGLGQTDGNMGNEMSMWSEEDEDYLFLLNSICKDAEEKYRNSPDVLVRKEIANARNWLKSLRPQNTYNPYKAVVESIAEMCKHYDKASHSGLRDFYDNVKVKCKEAQEYDKMFPQAQWKPTDEQMGCLSDAIEHYNSLGYPAPKLKELLDDLKKLKEGKV